MTLEPIRHASVGDTVVMRLRAEIAEGRWPVGTRIPPETDLMSMLGVARGTLREALRSLQYTGLLDIRRGDGTYVRALSEVPGALSRSGATLADVLEAQALIEPAVARLAAERADDAQIALIDSALRARSDALADDDEAWLDAEIAAHRRIGEAAGNPILLEVYSALLENKRRAMRRSLESADFCRTSPDGHEGVLDAIRRRDPAAAERSARANVESNRLWDSSPLDAD